jgi:hypothetical protein
MYELAPTVKYIGEKRKKRSENGLSEQHCSSMRRVLMCMSTTVRRR